MKFSYASYWNTQSNVITVLSGSSRPRGKKQIQKNKANKTERQTHLGLQQQTSIHLVFVTAARGDLFIGWNLKLFWGGWKQHALTFSEAVGAVAGSSNRAGRPLAIAPFPWQVKTSLMNKWWFVRLGDGNPVWRSWPLAAPPLSSDGARVFNCGVGRKVWKV